ncbi:hypothetical protein FACS1894156_2740 [Bacteroidia bacterium]|nr:hypothetical protein FACS1894156_2740 [Bacteroidia bacterium]
MQNLTDRNFWVEYWKNYQYEKIPATTPFEHLMPKLKGVNSFIEIGGFPGVYAAYFYKHGCKDVSLLDFYIDKRKVNTFEQINDIPQDTIHCIESDFFQFETNKQYDLVFSYGFIEHFEDTKNVMQHHNSLIINELLGGGGKLLIILPNFRGINGFVQYLFDKRNLRAHNLNSMKIPFLKSILTELELKNISVEYSRKPMVWLEPTAGNAFVRKMVKLFSYFLKLFPIKCRLLSPFIIIYAEK